MKYTWFDQYCLDKKGTEKDYQPEWEAHRYLLKGKMYCMVGGDKEGKPIITLKLEPSEGEQLRRDYKEIVPGYYMNKTHWNSVYVEGTVPDNVLKRMADESYRLVLAGLTKKQQKEILGADA